MLEELKYYVPVHVYNLMLSPTQFALNVYLKSPAPKNMLKYLNLLSWAHGDTAFLGMQSVLAFAQPLSTVPRVQLLH